MQASGRGEEPWNGARRNDEESDPEGQAEERRATGEPGSAGGVPSRIHGARPDPGAGSGTNLTRAPSVKASGDPVLDAGPASLPIPASHSGPGLAPKQGTRLPQGITMPMLSLTEPGTASLYTAMPRAGIEGVSGSPGSSFFTQTSRGESPSLFRGEDGDEAMDPVLLSTAHRQDQMPGTPWVMRQRWNDLLFAHWPVAPSMVERLLPPGLTVDTFDGDAWLGVVPFTMDQIQLRGLPVVPGANRFAELNLRTYVRERNTNQAGVYFFSLDATNPLAVAFARVRFHLPYFWARMQVAYGEGSGVNRVVNYTSTRLLSRPARFRASYRSLGQAIQGDVEDFLTARYSLYTTGWGGKLLRGRIHHLPWPLEKAEAEFELNELPQAFGLVLPDTAPLLHYSRELAVYIWSLEQTPLRHPSLGGVPAAVGETV